MIVHPHPDRRCWRYRRNADGGIDSQIFDQPELVPENEGWTDSPAHCPEMAASAPAAKLVPARKPGRPSKDALRLACDDAAL